MSRREWVLKRNCSISPRQLGMVFAALCFASLSVAVLFTVRGAWYVLAFAILELAAVGAAFLQYGRHATDRERIALADDCLLIERIEAQRVRRYRLDRCRARIEMPAADRDLVGLVAGQTRIEVGRYVTEWERREFARELRGELRDAPAANGGNGSTEF